MAQHDDKTASAELRAQRKAQALFEAQIDKGIAEALDTPAGRKMLWWLLAISRAVGVNSFSADPYRTAFQCGEQNVGQQVLARITEVSPEGFLAMQKENLNEWNRRFKHADDDDYIDPGYNDDDSTGDLLRYPEI